MAAIDIIVSIIIAIIIIIISSSSSCCCHIAVDPHYSHYCLLFLSLDRALPLLYRVVSLLLLSSFPSDPAPVAALTALLDIRQRRVQWMGSNQCRSAPGDSN